MKAQEAVVLRIKMILAEFGISVNALAYRAGIPPSTLRNIMNGVSHSTQITNIAKICDGLDITVREFFNHPIFSNLEQEIG